MIYYIIFFIIILLRKMFCKKSLNEEVEFSKLHEINVNWKYLFIYSENDKITDYMFLENFIKKINSNTTIKKFKNSSHVSHLMIYKDDYINEIKKFINNL
jgi:hypothetical protein